MLLVSVDADKRMCIYIYKGRRWYIWLCPAAPGSSYRSVRRRLGGQGGFYSLLVPEWVICVFVLCLPTRPSSAARSSSVPATATAAALQAARLHRHAELRGPSTNNSPRSRYYLACIPTTYPQHVLQFMLEVQACKRGGFLALTPYPPTASPRH